MRMDLKIWVTTFSTLAILSSGDATYPTKVLLRDIHALTLHEGHLTTGRRSSPVQQLSCVGGTAGCHVFVPKVVQCINQGSDGRDFQWECKTDMDNAYRFGSVTVSCEGFDYPDDPYVLQGSCGLEYTIDLTKEGSEQHNSHQKHSSYQSGNSYSYKSKESSEHGAGHGMFIIIVIIVIAGAAYYLLGSGNQTPDHQNPPSYAPPGYDSTPPPPGFAAPPPPGFRPEYMPGGLGHAPGSSRCDSQRNAGAPGGTGNFGGFWSGAATGGVLGYLFGARNNARPAHYYASHPSSYPSHTDYGSGGGSSWFGGGSGFGSASTTRRSGSSSSSGFSSSSGTRTASGFGGTSRR